MFGEGSWWNKVMQNHSHGNQVKREQWTSWDVAAEPRLSCSLQWWNHFFVQRIPQRGVRNPVKTTGWLKTKKNILVMTFYQLLHIMEPRLLKKNIPTRCFRHSWPLSESEKQKEEAAVGGQLLRDNSLQLWWKWLQPNGSQIQGSQGLKEQNRCQSCLCGIIQVSRGCSSPVCPQSINQSIKARNHIQWHRVWEVKQPHRR